MKIDSLLKNIDGVQVELSKDLTKFTTMKLQCVGDLVTVTSEETLVSVIKIFKQEGIKYQVLGLGANQLLKSSSKIPYLYLKFKLEENYFENVKEEYELPASVRLSTLTSHAAKFGLKGWEVFTGIPATLGGAIYMNAGTNLGEIGSYIKSVRIIDIDGNLREEKISKECFSYRKNHFVKPGDVIISAKLIHEGVQEEIKNLIKEYLQKRNASQPMSAATCGCVFKNPVVNGITSPAGKYIDILGLKGLQVGGIRISDKHGNFMENFNNATYEDVRALIDLVQKELYQQLGFVFELEVRI